MDNQLTTTTQNAGLNLFNPVTMEMALKATEMFTKSSLVPEMYREGGIIKKGWPEKNIPPVTVSPEQAKANVFIALDLANRLQANPLMVMQNLYIVEGHPSWSSSFLISTINTCGRFRPLKFYIGTETNPDKTPQMVQPTDAQGHPFGQPIPNLYCVAYTTERTADDTKANQLSSTKITMQMAISEGWYGKKGSKWQTMPEQMLRYRAAAFWVRTYAPELANGMYTAEEQQDNAIETEYEDMTKALHNTAGQLSFDTTAPATVPAASPAGVATVPDASPAGPATEQPTAQQVMEQAAQQMAGNWRQAAQQQPTDAQPGF